MEYRDSVIYTGGQSFDELASRFTISPAYGPAIANYNNYTGQDIKDGKFYVKIPGNWLKPEFVEKIIDLRNEGQGKGSVWLLGAAALAAILLIK